MTKIIIFDYQQVAISNLMEQIGATKIEVNESLLRHMILNTIRTYVKKFKNTYGPEVVIACDSKHYWRKEIFPYYKAGRKKLRDASGHDWNLIFESLNKIREELKEYSPYKVVYYETCEADDIISVLSRRFSANDNILILSSDKDFAQLQKYKNIVQYSPIMKKFLKEESPIVYLKRHIIKGDKGDGVPNILTPDDVFVTGGRQKTITEAKLSLMMNQSVGEFNAEVQRNYNRNCYLIDLEFIPQELQDGILHTYQNTVSHSKQKFVNYLIANKLKNLLEVVDEF